MLNKSKHKKNQLVTITSTLSRGESSSNKGQTNNTINKPSQIGGTTTDTTTGSPIILNGTQEEEVEEKTKKCMLSGWKSRESERNKVRLRDTDGFRMRAAALCIKGTGKETLVLLVSGGKDGGKWVVPGGGIEKDECAEEAAHRELMEEAGVRATTLKKMGMFQDDVRKHRTQVFLMEVSEELQTWEENEYGRQRIWMNLLESKEKVKQAHRPMLEALMR
uniref:diphosphoinositol-polyphosphate diphosphatase n=1 Tax=Caenorhabditis tropicalis TaxID=1561998 RepID=A0A1I7UEL4_9PELO